MIAVILAKRSTRFPGKHMEKLDGETLIGHITKKLVDSHLFSDVLIFTKDPEVSDYRATVLQDDTEGNVLDSIAAIVKFRNEVFVFAGDMPFVSVDFISDMFNRYDGYPLFPVHSNGLLEPLLGIYNNSMLKFLRDPTNPEDRSLKGWIKRSGARTIQIQDEFEESFYNINTESDLSKAREKIN